VDAIPGAERPDHSGREARGRAAAPVRAKVAGRAGVPVEDPGEAADRAAGIDRKRLNINPK